MKVVFNVLLFIIMLLDLLSSLKIVCNMNVDTLNSLKSGSSYRTIDDLFEKYLLLIPDEEITFRIKVSKLTTLRMWFEPLYLDVALKENVIEL